MIKAAVIKIYMTVDTHTILLQEIVDIPLTQQSLAFRRIIKIRHKIHFYLLLKIMFFFFLLGHCL